MKTRPHLPLHPPATSHTSTPTSAPDLHPPTHLPPTPAPPPTSPTAPPPQPTTTTTPPFARRLLPMRAPLVRPSRGLGVGWSSGVCSNLNWIASDILEAFSVSTSARQTVFPDRTVGLVNHPLTPHLRQRRLGAVGVQQERRT